jgi:hypothetical protein
MDADREHERALDDDFGTHHDGADGLHGLHDSIHHETVHLAFSGEEHHGLAEHADDDSTPTRSPADRS